MIRKLLVAIAILLSTSMVSHAGVLAGGPLIGHSTQTYAFVMLYNAGTTPITIVSKEISTRPDIVLPIADDTLPPDNILPPGTSGRFYANIQGSKMYSAKVTVEGSAEALVGVFSIRSPSSNQGAVNMRPIR